MVVERRAHAPKNLIETSNALGGNKGSGDFVQDVPTEVEEDSFADPYPLARRSLPGNGKEREREGRTPTIVPTRQYEDLVVYCDGACKNNGTGASVAGIGVWWGHDDKRNMCERCPGLQTNNCAELVAIVRVLEKTSIDVNRKLVIKTDSQYAINCLTLWVKNWNRFGNPWRKTNGHPVLNSELISYAYTLIECRKMLGQTVKLVYVKGHAGSEGNEAADKLANQGCTLKDKKMRDWAAKEKKYKKDAEKTRLEVESGASYLRREGSVRIDVIGTSQEERELGGFQMKTSRPTEDVVGGCPQTRGEKERSTSEFIHRPVGPLLRYRSDQSVQSRSPSSPKGSLPTQEMGAPSLGEDAMASFRLKRANKYKLTSMPHRSARIGAANNRADTPEAFSDDQDSDLEAYAQCLADSDDLENDLSD
ncbi:hypothetical protein E1B28_001677 [Marasmius oreades]|nr:uncharacterized protein E1B28_001677 [Marasmius oreades]KAG7099875.1 hypothetical protein E1B28_001677 [Marasmius oreades]